MELICPSCEARYGIPDGSIGEKGRQVSCMNCGHGWHAFPPLVLGAAQAAGSPAAGMQWRDPDGGAAAPSRQDVSSAPAAKPNAETSAASASGAVAAASGTYAVAESEPSAGLGERSTASRSEQLMEIRETLAEIQSEDRAATPQDGSASEQSATLNDFRQSTSDRGGLSAMDRMNPQESERRQVYAKTSDAVANEFGEDTDGEVDLLRRRMEQSEAREKVKPADVKRLRKKHDRKVRRKHRSSAAGSGAFLTGFLLVAIIASVLISLYLLAPQIIERVPAVEQAMTEYVATVDGLRVSIAETYQSVAGWVSESLEGKI